MTLSYTEALSILEIAADEIGSNFRQNSALVPILEARERIASCDVHSSIQTPVADSSAMDGYAVASACTHGASAERPVVLRVGGVIAAGDRSVRKWGDDIPSATRSCLDNLLKDARTKLDMDADQSDIDSAWDFGSTAVSKIDIPPCIEVMTGARFPPTFVDGGKEWVFRVYDVVLRKGQTLRPQHVMALASLGIHEIRVLPVLRVAILSIGEEIVSHRAAAKDHLVRDANGLFLETGLQSLGAIVCFWGVVGDDRDQFAEVQSARLRQGKVDVVMSTGAVSMGRFDFVEAGVARCQRAPRPSDTLRSCPSRR